MSVINSALQFIIETIFDFAITLLILRVILQYLRVPTRNPVILFIAKITNPIVWPLKWVVPNLGRIDFAAIIASFIVAMLKLLLLIGLVYGIVPPIAWLVVHIIGELLNSLLHIYLFSIIILVLASWFAPAGHNPVLDILYSITAPLLIPAQRMIPPIGGLDLSPMLVIFAIMLIRIVVVGSLLS